MAKTQAREAETGESMRSGRVRLTQWIERSKLSQVEAAEIIGIDKTALNHLLCGRRPAVGLRNALRIERATGIPVEAWAPMCDDESSLNDVAPVDQPLVDEA